MSTTPFAAASENSYFGFGVQVSQGTGVVPDNWLAFMEAIEITHGQNIRQLREAGSSQVVARSVKDSYIPGARAGAPVRADIAGAVLAAFLGADAISGASDPYTHVLTKDGNTDWVSVEYNNADEMIERVIDAFFMEVEISIVKRTSGPEILMAATVGGLDLERQAAATAESYEADRPFRRSDIAWSIDGTTETNVESASIRMRWTFDEAMLADQVIRVNAVKTQFDADIEVVQIYGGAGEREKLKYININYPNSAADGTGTATSEIAGLVGSLTLDANHTEGAASAARQFKVEIPVVRWTDAMMTPPNPESSEASRLTTTGHLENNAGAEDITVTVKSPASAAYV